MPKNSWDVGSQTDRGLVAGNVEGVANYSLGTECFLQYNGIIVVADVFLEDVGEGMDGFLETVG